MHANGQSFTFDYWEVFQRSFMFGYVVINKPELKFKEFDVYKGYYCGLCHCLKERYGITGQVTLTYDMTFLSLLLTSLYEAPVTEEHHRCISHPQGKHLMLSSSYTDYVADMNVVLAYFKARDDWYDDKNIIMLAFSSILKRKCKSFSKKNSRADSRIRSVSSTASNFGRESVSGTEFDTQIESDFCDKSESILYREKVELISRYLDELQQYEETGETNIDLVAGSFGKIMSVLFTPKDDQWAPILSRMGFFLGKFIYILDAYKDLEKDLKKGSYNPFKNICKDEDFDDRIKQMLTMMMAACSKEFEFLPILDNANILRNILYAGVWTKYYE